MARYICGRLLASELVRADAAAVDDLHLLDSRALARLARIFSRISSRTCREHGLPFSNNPPLRHYPMTEPRFSCGSNECGSSTLSQLCAVQPDDAEARRRYKDRALSRRRIAARGLI
jgi:hypothetical protein